MSEQSTTNIAVGPGDQVRVLMLIAHTGGGHLRAAEAVAEALRRRRGASVRVEIVDALGRYAPPPFHRLADLYPHWVGRAAWSWAWGYRLSDGPRRATGLLRLFWPLVWPRARRLLDRHPADVLLSAHPLTNHYLAWGLRRLGRAVPLLTLVTDPVSVHPFWLCPAVDRCLVGSEAARREALACGLPPERVRVTGLPVDPRFVARLTDAARARAALGWPADLPAVLLVGGGEGMGRVYDTACAIEARCRGVQLAVVAGRNRRLERRLRQRRWRVPCHVYGFVEHMPLLMSAADLLVTKAGPATLHEAFLAGLPLILNSAIPGQETGNVRMVVESRAGVWAPDPAQAAALVARLTGPERGRLEEMGRCARALARPEAAAAVADEVWERALRAERAGGDRAETR